MYDSEDGQSLLDMHRNIVVREFKYQLDESIKLVVGHSFRTLDFFRQMLIYYCIKKGVSIKRVKMNQKGPQLFVWIQLANGGCIYHMHVS